MRSLSLLVVLGVSGVLVGACSGSNLPVAPYAPPRPRPPIVEGTVPLTTPARWLFDSGDPGPSALDLGAAGRLHTAPHGMRWLARGAALTAAETLLPEEILETFTLGGRIHFVGRDGHVFVTGTPLGPIEATHSTPRTPRSASFGQKTLLVVGNDGTVHRSLDGGAHFTEVIFVASGAPRLARTVTVGSNGRGVIEGAFERAWTTVDDGASFAPFMLPNDAHVWRDRRGGVRIGSFALDADGKLFTAPAASALSDEMPEPTYAPQRHLLGDGVFEARASGGGFEVTVRAPDGKAKWVPARALAGCDTIALGGRHALLYVACSRGNATSLFASTDGGASFVEDGRVEARGPVTIHAGPDRWVALAPRCDKDCTSLFIRTAAGGPLHPALQAPARVDAFVAAPGGVPAAIQRVGNLWSMVTFARDQPTVTTIALAPKGEWALGGVDAGGNVVAAHVDGPRIELVSFNSTGKSEAHVIPLRRRRDERSSDGLERIALSTAGKRGLLAIGARLYETIDSATTFTRVASPTASPNLRCAEWGCEIDRTLRLGWDLAAPGEGPARLGDGAPLDAPMRLAPGGPPLRCKPNGVARTVRLPELGSTVAAPRGAARLAWVSRNPGLQVNVVDAADPKTMSLLEAGTDVVAESVQPSDDGIIAARVSKARVEIAWWSSVSRKTTAVDLGPIAYASPRAPFVGFSDKGVVVYTAGAIQPEVIFIDGPSKITRFPGDPLFARVDHAHLAASSQTDVRTVLFANRHRVIAARTSSKEASFTAVSDSLRSDLQDHALRRGYFGPLPDVEGAFLARGPEPFFAIAMARGDDHSNRFFRLSPWSPGELPAVAELPAPTSSSPACSPALRGAFRAELPLGLRERRPVIFDDGVAPRALALSEVVFAPVVTPSGGSTCVSAWSARAPGGELFVYGDNSALYLGYGKATLTPLSCAPATSTDLAKAAGMDDLVLEL